MLDLYSPRIVTSWLLRSMSRIAWCSGCPAQSTTIKNLYFQGWPTIGCDCNLARLIWRLANICNTSTRAPGWWSVVMTSDARLASFGVSDGSITKKRVILSGLSWIERCRMGRLYNLAAAALAIAAQFRESFCLMNSTAPAVSKNSIGVACDKLFCRKRRSRLEERRVGKECRSRWSPYH